MPSWMKLTVSCPFAVGQEGGYQPDDCAEASIVLGSGCQYRRPTLAICPIKLLTRIEVFFAVGAFIFHGIS